MIEKCKKTTMPALMDLARELEDIFDLVRVVDPYCVQVLFSCSSEEETKKPALCFEAWDRNSRCANCISLRACAEKKRMSKFEFVNGEVFSVVATPFQLISENGEERLVALEILNNITDEMEIRVSGENIIAKTMEDLDKKLYEDALTGAYNRRFFEDKRFIYGETGHLLSKKMGFIVVDIRKFKTINDTYGHLLGDMILRDVAASLKKLLTAADSLVRFGGDEYLLILPNCEEARVRKITEYIQTNGCDFLTEEKKADVELNAGYAYTCSFDASSWQIAQLFQAADQNMYHDKQTQAQIAD